jgi:tetratricopeptide (TPR) repeat protein
VKIKILICFSVIVPLFGILCFQGISQDLKEIRHRAKKAINQEQFVVAIPLLKKLVEVDSSDSEILFNLALAMYSTEDYHGCIKYSTKGIEVEGTYAAHHFRRGICYSKLQDYHKAILDYNKAIELDKKPFTYFNRAIARWKAGDPEGGITDFTTAIELNPKDVYGFYYRALCYLELGDTIKAITDLNNSIALKPKDPDIYDERAYLRFSQKHYQEAKSDYLKCVALDQTYIQGYLSLSEISLMTGNWIAAYQHASNAVQYASDNDERALGLLFKCAASKLIDRNYSDDEALLIKELHNLKETSWDFDELKEALKRQKVIDEKWLYIANLIKRYYQE